MAIQERGLPILPAPLRMTLEEFLVWDGPSLAEWINGEVTFMTVTDRHQALVLFFAAILGTWVQEHLLGLVTGEPYGMRMAQTPAIREPDV